MQGHRATQPAKWLPALLQWRGGQIIKCFGKFTAALRKKNAARVVLLVSFERAHQRFVQPALLGELCGAQRASGEMRFNKRGLLLCGFAAGIKNQQCRSFFATERVRRAHSRPPSWLRSLRVARNSEFFTVSSVVPSASPIARNFNP